MKGQPEAQDGGHECEQIAEDQHKPPSEAGAGAWLAWPLRRKEE